MVILKYVLKVMIGTLEKLYRDHSLWKYCEKLFYSKKIIFAEERKH